jgi:2-iminobutanoate/2-iminopropanoate deaminase
VTAIEKRPLNALDAVQPTGGYPQAVEVVGASRLLFVSGQIPVRADGTLPKEFKDQARLAWTNVEAQLRAAGMSLDNLVKVTIFLSDRAYNLDNREVRRAVLGERPVALTVIITGIFDPAWLLEIEAVAAA